MPRRAIDKNCQNARLERGHSRAARDEPESRCVDTLQGCAERCCSGEHCPYADPQTRRQCRLSWGHALQLAPHPPGDDQRAECRACMLQPVDAMDRILMSERVPGEVRGGANE